jgi:hypothetical protein
MVIRIPSLYRLFRRHHADTRAVERVADLDPLFVRCALTVGKCLTVVLNQILDEFDESELPFTRTAILAALLNAAEENQPFNDPATVADLASLCDILHRRRLRRRACTGSGLFRSVEMHQGGGPDRSRRGSQGWFVRTQLRSGVPSASQSRAFIASR